MDNELIKICCPTCRAVLSVRQQPGMSGKAVTCPMCKTRRKFSEYRVVSLPVEGAGPHHSPGPVSDGTVIDTCVNYAVGSLTVMESGQTFNLKKGTNIIGRQSKTSKADFQIPCQTQRMSREHLVVEVREVPSRGLVHYASLVKEQVYPTFVGSLRMVYGDTVVLKNGDTLTLPDASLKLVIPDDEGTRFA